LIRRIAGIHTSAFATGDGGPALLANIQPKGIAIGPDGSVYFTDAFATVRRISPSGIITTIAGKGSSCVNELTDPTCAVGGPARQSRLRDLTRISVAPDGSLYFSQRSFSRVRRIAPLLPGYDGNAISIASADGAEVYQFDASGHHLRTIVALSKRPLFTFGYNSLGLLTTITDADSNISQLERNAQGDLTAVIGPFGQRNTVMLDARGFLSSITNPANEVTQFQHDTLGLLKHIIDPKGNPPHQFFYDSLGLIQRDQESDGAFKTLVRQSSDTSITAALTTALGRVTTYAVRFAADSSRLRSQTDPAGLSTFTVEGINGDDGRHLA
jgi:YD repeat-containing protein